MQWSSDGTQFAGTSADGNVFLAYVLKRSVMWRNIEVNLATRKSVEVSEYTTNSREKLVFRERVIQVKMLILTFKTKIFDCFYYGMKFLLIFQLSLNHGYIVVVIPTQVYVYNVAHIEQPIICELKENVSVNLILQSKK